MALKKCTDCTKDETAEELYDDGKGECSKCKNYETFKVTNKIPPTLRENMDYKSKCTISTAVSVQHNGDENDGPLPK